MANITLLDTGKDVSGSTLYAIQPSNLSYRVTLAANSASGIVVPTGATHAIFAFGTGGDVFVDYTTTATLPVSPVFALTTSELNPSARKLTFNNIPITNLSFICGADNYVNVSFYVVNAKGNSFS